MHFQQAWRTGVFSVWSITGNGHVRHVGDYRHMHCSFYRVNYVMHQQMADFFFCK